MAAKKVLSPAQRHVLEVLAAGGMIVHQPGVRGVMISYRLYAKGSNVGEDIAAATFDSLTRNPWVRFSYQGQPPLIEFYQPRGVNLGRGAAHRITAAGRAALKADRAAQK